MNTSTSKVEKGNDKNAEVINLVKQYAVDIVEGKTKWNRIPPFIRYDEISFRF